MKSNQILGIALIGVSLFLLYSNPGVVPSPSEPVNVQLVNELKPFISGPNGSEDAENLGRCLLATANLIALDSQREKQLYKDNESIKWVIKNVGDMSYPIGWKMSEKYPNLPSKLGGWLSSQLGENPDRANFIAKVRELGYALKAI